MCSSLALQDGVLPLYIRYSTVCDDALDAATWVARLAVEALRHTLHADPAAGGPRDLYEDLKAAMQAKGVNLKALSLVDDDTRSFEDRLRDAKKVLRDADLKHLWIIVDEVETPGDLKRGLREDTQTKVDDEYLLMVSEVIKHENWRNQHPDVNFLLLCSVGMRDQIHIGPNLRRASSVTIEPNQLTDVQSYVDHIKGSLADPHTVEYPAGTLEGAFLSANRNFGWLNVIMASIHETYARHMERGDSSSAWELLKDFAKTDARAKHIFNDDAVLPLLGKVTGVPKQEVERLVYGQLPAPVGGAANTALTEEMADALLAHEVAGRGHAFAELFQVHIDERALANELTRPEFGFKAKEGKTDTYFTPNCEVSVVGLLEALRAFSVAVGGAPGAAGDFVVYTDLEQWGEQLAALYPREGIEFAAESLHRIFSKPEYRVDGTRFIGMSFRLWREFNKLLVSAAESVRFFKDGKHEAPLDQYVRGVSQTKAKRGTAICLGLAKLLDDHLKNDDTRQVSGLKDVPHKAFTSAFGSPSLDGLRVTPDGRCTIVYCLDAQETLDKLRAYIGLERVHPILVLFPASADVASFEQQLDASPALRRCVLTRRLVSQEEEFLLKYSGRGSAYNAHEARLSKVAKGLEGSYRDEWQAKSREWANGLRKTGYLLAPIWSRKTGNNTADFAKGYRYMLAKDCSLDAAVDTAGGPLNNVEFENCRQAGEEEHRCTCRVEVRRPPRRADDRRQPASEGAPVLLRAPPRAQDAVGGEQARQQLLLRGARQRDEGAAAARADPRGAHRHRARPQEERPLQGRRPDDAREPPPVGVDLARGGVQGLDQEAHRPVPHPGQHSAEQQLPHGQATAGDGGNADPAGELGPPDRRHRQPDRGIAQDGRRSGPRHRGAHPRGVPA